MLRIITFISSAGGAGRSSLVANLAAELVVDGHPVAVLELDAQNVMAGLLGERLPSAKGVMTLGEAPAGWRSIRIETALGVTLLPAGHADAAAQARTGLWLARDPAGLRRQLESAGLPEGTRVLIDTARLPSSSARAAITAADLTIGVVPVTTTGFVTMPDLLKVETNNLQLVANWASSPSMFNNDLMHMLRARAGDALIPVRVHRDDAIGMAAAAGKPVRIHRPDAQSALDFAHLAAWLLRATTALDAEGAS